MRLPIQGEEFRYTAMAKVLHWLVVALLIAQYIVAWLMPHIGRNTKPDTTINLHFSFGVVILALIIARLAWRWTHPEPVPHVGLPRWQATSSYAVHYALYLLLFVVPILGWMNASFRGFDVNVFGLFVLPKLIATRRPGFGWTGDVHMIIGYYVLLPLIGLHILGALYNAFVRRNAVLARMLPAGWA